MRLFNSTGFAKPTISKTNIQPKNNPSPAQHIQTNNTKAPGSVDGFSPADDIKRDNALALVKGKKVRRREATERSTAERQTTQNRTNGRKKRKGLLGRIAQGAKNLIGGLFKGGNQVDNTTTNKVPANTTTDTGNNQANQVDKLEKPNTNQGIDIYGKTAKHSTAPLATNGNTRKPRGDENRTPTPTNNNNSKWKYRRGQRNKYFRHK